MDPIDLISVHVPKCAGSSLGRALEEACGKNSVYFDYGDRPADPASPMNLDPDRFFEQSNRDVGLNLSGKRVVHGHFHPNKYKLAPAKLRITLLREPVERAISHYFFWKKMPRHGHVLHDYFLDRELGLLDFVRLPTIREFYTRSFFGSVNMAEFDIIGLYDKIDIFYRKIEESLNIEMSRAILNKNPSPNYQADKACIFSNQPLIQSLRGLLKNDIAFYEKLASSRAAISVH